MRVAALYIRGRIVLGSSHLDAFEQLSDEERCSNDMSSGFFDEDTGEFSGYQAEEHFFNKQILMMRHGVATNQSNDPPLAQSGIPSILNLVQDLKKFDLKGYIGYTSPLLRCLMTAELISQATGLNFVVEPQIAESPLVSETESLYVENRSYQFPDYKWPAEDGWWLEHESASAFRERTLDILKRLPQKTFLVSHRGVIVNMVRFALCDEKVHKFGVPNASMTFIDNNEVKCLGKTSSENDCQN